MSQRTRKSAATNMALHAARNPKPFTSIGYMRNRFRHFFPEGIKEIASCEGVRFISSPAL